MNALLLSLVFQAGLYGIEIDGFAGALTSITGVPAVGAPIEITADGDGAAFLWQWAARGGVKTLVVEIEGQRVPFRLVDAAITKIELSRDMPPRFTLVPQAVATGALAILPPAPIEKAWVCSNFKLEIDGMPTSGALTLLFGGASTSSAPRPINVYTMELTNATVCVTTRK